MSPRLVHMAIFYRFTLGEGRKFARLPFAVSRIEIFHKVAPGVLRQHLQSPFPFCYSYSV